MGVSVTQMAEELKEITEWQKTPEAITFDQYINMIIRGIKKLFIDTNRPTLYNDSLVINEDGEIIFNMDLPINEQEYVLICAQIIFYQKVQTDVTNIVGYTTNALTITNADKPYTNLQNTLSTLELERRRIYYKMVAYSLGE